MTKLSTIFLDQVFVDTSFFKAMLNTNDDFHKRATTIWQHCQQAQASLITSNFIIDECVTLLRKRLSLRKALQFKFLVDGSNDSIVVQRVTQLDEAAAWQWFIKDWSKLSFTDCVSFAQMERLGIKQVLSFDRHFERAGFTLYG